MSYYNIHPVFGQRAASPTPSPCHPLTLPGLRQHHHAAASPFATPDYDLEDQERAALAHLRHIQARREAQQAAIEREAAIRFREQEERELVIRRAIAEKRREQAIAQAIERQREQAIERARIQHAFQQRQQAEAQHHQRLIEHQQQQRAAQLHAAQQLRQQQVAQATERAKRCAAKYAQRATQQVAKEVKKEYKDEYAALNNLLGGLFGIELADEKEEVKEVKPQPTQPTPAQAPAFPANINDILSHFLGVHVEPTSASAQPKPTAAPEPKAAPAPEEDQHEAKKGESASPQSTRASADKLEVKTAPAPTPSTTDAFPEDVNDLLSHFLGLRIEPATSADKPNSTPADATSGVSASNDVPVGLNEFLSRFGLVFEPVDVERETKAEPTPAPAARAQDKVITPPTPVADPPEPTLPAPSVAASSSSSSRAQPRASDDHPLTTFLNGMADMPPFVRDILGNVEMAFKAERDRSEGQSQQVEEAVKGKGKAVADGEKPTRAVDPIPAPAPAPTIAPVEPTTETAADPATAALSSLSIISSDLDLVRRSFDFPPTLSFSTPSDDNSAPALLFNKANSGYHAQAHKLLQLLLAADAITSDGNKDVRRMRKQVVREVEREIEELEKRRDEVWETVKVQRERGEVEPESEGSSCSSSVVDPSEVKEEVEHVEHAEVEGFEVSAGESESVTTPTPAAESNTSAEVTARVTEEKIKEPTDQAAKVEKDEGYELL